MPNGPCSDTYCTKCIEDKQRVDDMVECARHAYTTAISHRGIPEDVREQIFHDAYHQAMHEVSGQHQRQLVTAQQQGYAQAQTMLQHDLTRQRNDAYQRGFQAGRLSAPPIPAAASRKEMVDLMLNECKIIAESNPNMKPGVNAVRHRIKKLGKQ